MRSQFQSWVSGSVVLLVWLVAETSVAREPKRSRRPAADDSECTPGYDPCIPPGPDVDCAGGSGDGPRYVEGPVRVTGSDPYRLDRDHDGIACD